MTTEEKELLRSVRADVLNLGASFNKLIEALVPITEIIQRQEAKIDSNAAAVELMLREQAGLSSKAEKAADAAEEIFQGLVKIGTSLATNGDNQMIDNKNITAIWNVVSATDKKVDESFKSIISKIGSLNATLDNQWANR